MSDGDLEEAGLGEASSVHAGADAERDQERAAVAELERVLLAEGPRAMDELAAAFAERSPQLAADLLAGHPGTELADRLGDLVQRADEIWRLPDGRWAPVLHHLRRSVLTHRLTPGELERQAVDLTPDLVALALPRSSTLADGTSLTTAGPADDDERAAEGGSLLGPDGWLSARGPGDLVAARYDGDEVRLDWLTDADLDETSGRAAGEALRSTFATLEGARAPEAHRLVVDTLGNAPEAFATPVAPLVELLDEVGLRVRDAWVGPAGAPWATPLEQARERRLEELLAGADGCCRRAARRALHAWEAWLEAVGGHAGPAATDQPAPLVEDIDHGPVAAALVEVAAVGRAVTSVRRLGAWASQVAAEAGTPSPGLAYLQARGADAAGDGLAAEAHLRAGLDVAPDHPACLAFLAELTEDRGDAPGSMALLRRAGREPGPEARRELAPFLLDRPVGRNEACPCGSGRKYKACCSGRSIRRPLAERCRWLLSKATRHAARSDPSAVQGLQQLFDPSIGGAATGFVVDSLLFAGGGLRRYLDARGALLPADELATARTWPGQPMRLLEVVATAPDGSVELADQRSGERLTVAGWADGADRDAGQAVLARALPVEVDDVWLLSGAVVDVPPSALARASELAEGDVGPFQLLQLLVDVQVDALRGRAPSDVLAQLGDEGGG